ncbi:NAD-dependent epimerase/dehydratase family protein [candidate division KSB1 bacterium]|nr:NAD-dependent epimerase/dehydratase family protein [candidate division KSB1 bacterium]
MKKILVTGATGFTGGHLAQRLAKEGANVRTLARPGEDCAALEAAGIEIVRGDLTDRDSLFPAVQNVEIVYHIAAAFREEGVPQQLFWDVNVEGTRNLMNVSISAGIKRFVHCSTVGVQGEIKNPPATEEAPYQPGDYYQESKVDGEKLVLQYIHDKKFPAVIFRPVGIYGPGDTRFLKIFRFIHKGSFRMFGSGKVLYHLTYVEDLVDGIILAGTVPDIEGEIFTLGGAQYVPLNELVQLIGHALNKTVSTKHIPVWPVWLAGAICEALCRPFRINPPLYRRRVDFFIKDRAFDISKAQSRLGYAPKVDLQTGLKRTAEWYHEEHLLD